VIFWSAGLLVSGLLVCWSVGLLFSVLWSVGLWSVGGYLLISLRVSRFVRRSLKNRFVQ